MKNWWRDLLYCLIGSATKVPHPELRHGVFLGRNKYYYCRLHTAIMHSVGSTILAISMDGDNYEKIIPSVQRTTAESFHYPIAHGHKFEDSDNAFRWDLAGFSSSPRLLKLHDRLESLNWLKTRALSCFVSCAWQWMISVHSFLSSTGSTWSGKKSYALL